VDPVDKKSSQVSLIIKEADREISEPDADFIAALITEWLIRDYLRKKSLTEAK